MRIITPKKAFSDDRGKIETISAGQEWREINQFTSMPGKKRGNHYHKETLELIYVVKGKIEIECVNVRTGEKQAAEISRGQGVLIEPYEKHTVDILEPTVWIALLSKEYNNTSPDVH